jgi:cell division protein FtsW (lipid II flippase)
LPSILILGFGMLIIAGVTAYILETPLIVKERVDIWLNPFSQSENSAYSLWAISAGGLFGTGLGNGLPHAIPNAWADFNFASISEEFGFLGGAVVILAFWLILYRCYKIAMQRYDIYGKLLALGFMVALAVQGLLIAAGNMNLVPLTGITLPFVSHGGSSLLVSFIMMGILLRLSATDE